VHVGVRDLLADHQHPDPAGPERLLQRRPDVLGHRPEVGVQIVGDVDPVVDRLDRHDQRVAGGQGGDREERHHSVVPPHEPPGELAVDDPGEDRGHVDAL
jgi:hypothetical protein